LISYFLLTYTFPVSLAQGLESWSGMGKWARFGDFRKDSSFLYVNFNQYLERFGTSSNEWQQMFRAIFKDVCDRIYAISNYGVFWTKLFADMKTT
jgi:hypothetical protein